MNRPLLFKLGAIGLLMLILLIPLLMIGGLVSDRQQLRGSVLREIAHSSSGNQSLSGPIVVVPYVKMVREWKVDERSKERVQQLSVARGALYFLPERFDVEAKVRTEIRARGIYQARLFHADQQVQGQFHLPPRLGLGDDFNDYRFEPAYLTLGIADIRGIENVPALRIEGQDNLTFKPGSQVAWLGDGIHAPLPSIDATKGSDFHYAFDLSLQGTGQLQIVPVGRASTVHMSADWPHPSFVGNYLPISRDITANGFSAKWSTSFFSTNLKSAMQDCAKGKCTAFESRGFGVSFIEPVDQYLKSERAIKYALLFIALTFAGFFLFEVLKRIAVHPIQYGLVGLALALFFLLLLSLAEHIGFAWAYLVSASACVLLIGFYVSNVLRSLANGLGFTAALAVLYGLLYALLLAEDYALLMGAILLFAVLGGFMALTRRLDWYSVGAGKTAIGKEDVADA